MEVFVYERDRLYYYILVDATTRRAGAGPVLIEGSMENRPVLYDGDHRFHPSESLRKTSESEV